MKAILDFICGIDLRLMGAIILFIAIGVCSFMASRKKDNYW